MASFGVSLHRLALWQSVAYFSIVCHRLALFGVIRGHGSFFGVSLHCWTLWPYMHPLASLGIIWRSLVAGVIWRHLAACSSWRCLVVAIVYQVLESLATSRIESCRVASLAMIWPSGIVWHSFAFLAVVWRPRTFALLGS